MDNDIRGNFAWLGEEEETHLDDLKNAVDRVFNDLDEELKPRVFRANTTTATATIGMKANKYILQL